MSDHTRFIYCSLAPNETGEIERLQPFIQIFDNLLGLTYQPLEKDDLNSLNEQSYKSIYDFKSYILQLLALSLSSGVQININPTAINHILNETEEYILITKMIAGIAKPKLNSLHYHLLWLPDAAGHTSLVSAGLDETETDLIHECNKYKKIFKNLYIKALELNGYSQTKLDNFPAIMRLNKQAVDYISQFRDFLIKIRDMRRDGSLLGTLMPLLVDHMARESCYYFLKLSEIDDNDDKPDSNNNYDFEKWLNP